MIVSHSEIQDFLTCQRKWFYGYVQKIEPDQLTPGIDRGTEGHACIETFLQAIIGGYAPRDAIKLAHDEFESIHNPDIDDRYHMPLEQILFDWYFPNEPYVRFGWQPLAVEYKATIPLDVDLEYGFTADAVFYDTHGDMALVDHKFLGDFYSDAAGDLSPQIVRYGGALQVLGYPIKRGEYDMVRTKPLMKSHALPQRLSQMRVELTPGRVKQTMHETHVAALTIQGYQELDPVQLSEVVLRIGDEHVCKMCWYRDLCKAELDGNERDAQKIRTAFFRAKPERYGITNNGQD